MPCVVGCRSATNKRRQRTGCVVGGKADQKAGEVRGVAGWCAVCVGCIFVSLSLSAVAGMAGWLRLVELASTNTPH